MRVLTALFGSNDSRRAVNARIQANSTVQVTRRDAYELLRAYYMNNGLYDQVQQQLAKAANQKTAELTKGLRNPCFRVVEFYPSTICPGTLPRALEVIRPDGSADTVLCDDIKKLWRLSQWDGNKQVAVRFMAMYGDMILRVATKDGIPYISVVDPRNVTALQKDEFEKIVKIRLDYEVLDEFKERPIVDSLASVDKRQYTTEVWDLSDNSMKIWVHDKGLDRPLRELGDPVPALSKSLSNFGIDFLPFVHRQFRPFGEIRGTNAFEFQVDKIDALNYQVSRLHDVLFRYGRAFLAISANAKDTSGRPLPAPNFGNDSTVIVGGERILMLPGNASLDSTVPNIDWTGHLGSIKDQMDELSYDMPELNYYAMTETNASNARAAFLKLAPAISRVREVRGYVESGFVEAQRMALFMAGDGVFKTKPKKIDDDVSDHTFRERPYFEVSPADQAEIDLARVNVLVAKKNIGVDGETLLAEAGYTEEQVKKISENKKKELADMQQAFVDAGQNAGSQFPSKQQQNGQDPNFNKGAQTQKDNSQQPTQPNGQPTQARGFKG